ncbi:MAG: phytanoyl-CoA dioxygenase family protein [Planctomycetota bacterium]|jgi:chlorinating enzyme
MTTTTDTQAAADAHALSPEEVSRFDAEGYLGPFTMCSPEEMATIRERIANEVLTSTPSVSPDPRKDRYLDSRLIYELCTHPAIRGRMQSLYGPDLLLFATSLFVKNPKDPEFPWHCDGPYWPMNPLVGVTAWLSITEATMDNGCVSLVPRSHKQPVPHVPFGRDRWSAFLQRMGKNVIRGRKADTSYVDTRSPVHMPVKPGQFFLFTHETVHKAGANRTNEARSGLAIRVTVPMVRIRHDEIYPGHKAILISGEDRYGWNETAPPPE